MSKKARPASQPVTGHRLFPGLAALWFAALFGLGILVTGGDVLASLVIRLHLPAILPAAALPLGLTARLLLALGFAGLGGVFGLALGLAIKRRVTAGQPAVSRVRKEARGEAVAADDEVAPVAQRVRNRDAHPDAPPRRPLVVTEDVAPFEPERTVSEAVAPEAAIPEVPVAVDPTAEPSEPVVAVPADDVHEDAVAEESTPVPFAAFPSSEAHVDPNALPPFIAAALASQRMAEGSAQGDVEAASWGAADHPVTDFILDTEESQVLEPVEPAAGIAAHEEPLVAEVVSSEIVVGPEDHAPVAPEQVAAVEAEPALAAPCAPLASQASAVRHKPLTDAELESLGLVQLIERLALAIAERQELRGQGVDGENGHEAFEAAPFDGMVEGMAGEMSHPTPDLITPLITPLHRFDPLTMDPPGPLLKTKPVRANRPQAVVSGDDTDDFHAAPAPSMGGGMLIDPVAADDWDDDIDGDPVVPRFLGMTPAVAGEAFDDHAGEEDHNEGEGHGDCGHELAGEDPEDRYSSLIDMAMPRPELVSVPTPMSDPVVPFPTPSMRLAATAEGGEDISDKGEDADRALREALATLRRMTAKG
ncbi:hypothetical protein Y88_3002 [Novosphingobium nitrogenifigens DSM 19370]|uniref:Uncharacterized protein n=1 Tax=Novosphingobium nitrogenifigens DSM 19370 TaxID=983920 RepID=F1ZCB7_9SPHN|nr:hypothetical protein [Novosphingobium nitrogenifigens]EGD57676.1 hypothetical protein Y88_3002 [Novosphingobium nitrogenifigens DSM 19370]